MISIPNPLHPAVVHFPIVLIGTAAAVAAVLLRRWHLPWLAAGMLLAGAVGSAASYAVAETGHYGGLLVYEHGVGVKTPSASAPAAKQGDDD